MPVQNSITGSGAESIAASVEAAISDGSLAPGDALPPVRELAAQLGVNANTAAAAYRLLRHRGAVETAGRRGTRVRHRPATTPRSLLGLDVPAGVRDLSTGNPHPDLLPIARVAPVGPAPAVPCSTASRPSHRRWKSSPAMRWRPTGSPPITLR
nr:GntR family transcriptional regulator [Mycobacterium colombiense]